MYSDIETEITVCSDSRVVTKQDLKYFNNKIRSRSAKLASRVSIETLEGINHNIGRRPLAVGQLAARAFEG
jgi:hypothetical protein